MSDLSELRAETLLGIAESSGGTFTDAEVDAKIQREYEYIQTRLNMENDEFFSKQVSFSLTGVTDQAYAFPTDFVKLISIEIIQSSSGDWVSVPYVPTNRREEYSQSAWLVSNDGPYRYYIIGSNYYFVPTPPGGTNNGRMIYIYIPSALSADDDTPEFPSNYHEILSIGAINRLRKVFKEPPIDQDHYNFLLQSLIDSISPRVKNRPKQVRMISGLY